MTLLKQLRERTSISPEHLAATAGISVAWYYDLESQDDELTSNVSIGNIARLARELGVKASAIYGESSSKTVSLDHLASLVREHLRQSGGSLEDFEMAIGWSVAEALSNPEHFRGFNVDGLRAVAEAVHVDWREVLDGL